MTENNSTSRTKPQVDCRRLHPVVSVLNIPDAVSFYTDKLGFSPGFTWGDPPEFAGVNLGEVSIHLAKGTPNPNGSAVNFVVEDADTLFEFQRSNGIEIIQPPQDQQYGLRDFSVRDLHGHVLSFGHYIYHVGPPVKIERTEVTVRLEKRLAALLQDLAEHKRMSVGSCLEETLLHTFEEVGDGVASPHTKSTLRHIQELKKKHEIDYDCHASYRFVEEERMP